MSQGAIVNPNRAIPRFRLNNITPFTYRDGLTFLELIEELRQYVVSVIVPEIDEKTAALEEHLEEVKDSLDATLDSMHNQMVESLGEYSDIVVDSVDDFQRIHDAYMADVNASLMALNDSAVADLVVDTGTLLRQALENMFVSHVETNQRKVIATDPRFGTPYTLDSIYSALDYAESLGRGTIVEFPAGTYDVRDGLDLTDYSAQLRGDGAVGGVSDDGGTTFYASTQNGPVIDFTNWIHPPTFLGKAVHEGFRVRGSNITDPSKLNVGMRFGLIMSVTFRDISIEHTGGPGMYGSADTPGRCVHLSDFERIVIRTPVDAQVNDVPYAHFHGANGNRFRSLHLRSPLEGNNLGTSGAVIFESDGVYQTHANHLDSPWVEYMHIPSGASIYRISDGVGNIISDPYFVDVTFEDESVQDASYITFERDESLGFGDHGANRVTGTIMGSQLRQNVPRYGVRLLQSRNSVEGPRGYPGHNVYIGPGVVGSYINLGGGVATSFGPAVVDESGNSRNTYFDANTGIRRYGVDSVTDSYLHSVKGRVLAAEPRYLSDTSNPQGLVFDCALQDTYEIMLNQTGGVFPATIINPVNGSELTLLIRQGGGATTQLDWGVDILWVGQPPVLTDMSTGHNVITLKYVDGRGWFEVSRNIPHVA